MFLKTVSEFLLVDADECTDTSLCANGTCVNNDGSYTCTCNVGYEDDGTGMACQGKI